MGGKEAHRRLAAAQMLLLESLTSREKFSSIRALISGIHPKIDDSLSRIDQHLSAWDKVASGDVISLSAEHLPENTEEEKKRKKWLLIFVNSWRQLGSEVERVRAEMAAAEKAPSAGDKASHWGRVFRFARGPFGIVTILAAGAVFAMQATAVTITIQNKGCGTMYPSGSIPISIPGLSLPKDPIPSGGSANVVIPGVTVNVDGTQKGAVSLGVLNYSLSFQLPLNVKDVTMDGTSLLGKKTEVKLSEKNQHALSLVCS